MLQHILNAIKDEALKMRLSVLTQRDGSIRTPRAEAPEDMPEAKSGHPKLALS